MSAPLDPSAALAAQAQQLDRADGLANLRARFAMPRAGDGSELAYLCGHSLGLAPLAARSRVLEEVEDWERLAVAGHEAGRRPWIDYAAALAAPLARLAGAQAPEVVAMNSLTVNLHLLMASFYRPGAQRHRILIEAGAFPSDRQAVVAQIDWHGFDAHDALIELAPRPGEATLRAEDIVARIEAERERLALVVWPGVQYRTGQAFELEVLTRAAHRVGALIGFDLAHAIGNLPLALHDGDADFAVWCSYKYLNGGPGAIGGAFVHERHAHRPALPRLAGWWGSARSTRFQMSGEFELIDGAAGWQVSNPPILAAAPLLASLELFDAAGIAPLRAKSLQLTGFLESSLRQLCGTELEFLTPAPPAARGCQLSVRVRGAPGRARGVYAELAGHGVVTDWREPDTIRMAPVPLYNRYQEAARAALAMAAALRSIPA